MADTNSTLNILLDFFDPYFSLLFKISLILKTKPSFENSIFKKPGPAISIFLKCTMFLSNKSLMLLAKSLGLILLDFAKIRETLDERSKLKCSGGTSKFTFSRFLSSISLS